MNKNDLRQAIKRNRKKQVNKCNGKKCSKNEIKATKCLKNKRNLFKKKEIKTNKSVKYTFK